MSTLSPCDEPSGIERRLFFLKTKATGLRNVVYFYFDNADCSRVLVDCYTQSEPYVIRVLIKNIHLGTENAT